MHRTEIDVQTGVVTEIELTQEEIDALTATAANMVQQPIVVSPRQIRQALTSANLRSSVEAGVAAGDQDLKDWWEYATSFEENHPQVLAMAAALNVSETALHDLFVLASTL
jgi:hypothetical protein